MQEEGSLVKIARMGHAVLMHPAKKVENISAPAVQAVIDDLLLAHAQSGGVGVAAPQIFSALRILVFAVPPSCAIIKRVQVLPVTVLVNPVVEVLDDTIELDWEGCLSVPGMYGEVPRARKIRYSAFDRSGQAIAGELEGYAARILLHEVDHLNGVVYPMRINDLTRFGFLEEIREFHLD